MSEYCAHQKHKAEKCDMCDAEQLEELAEDTIDDILSGKFRERISSKTNHQLAEESAANYDRAITVHTTFRTVLQLLECVEACTQAAWEQMMSKEEVGLPSTSIRQTFLDLESLHRQISSGVHLEE